MLLAAGCTTVIVPPPAVADPVPVVVVDHGKHSSLVLDVGDGTSVEYAYGEWGWFARSETGWYEVFPALLCPTQGTLGRRELAVPADPESVRGAIPGEEHLSLAVERARSDALRARLDALVEHAAERHWNDEYQRWFVPHARDYHVFHNCTHRLGAWLRELGCEVRTGGIYSNYRVEPD